MDQNLHRSSHALQENIKFLFCIKSGSTEQLLLHNHPEPLVTLDSYIIAHSFFTTKIHSEKNK